MNAHVCMDCGVETKGTGKRCYSCARKALCRNPEHLTRQSVASKAVCDRPGQRMKMSKAAKQASSKAEVRERMSVSAKRRFSNPENLVKMSQAVGSACSTDSHKRKLSEAIRLKWQDVEYIEKQKRALKSSSRFLIPSSLETLLSMALDEAGLMYEQQFSLPGHRRYYDFALVNCKLLIEVDGDYWHSKSENVLVDAEKDDLAIKSGYSIMRIPECELKRLGADVIVRDYVLPEVL